MALTIRRGGPADSEALYRLNRDLLSESWSRASICSALASGYDLILCDDDGILLGYLLALQVAGEIQIMQIAVSPRYRRQGLARRMIAALIAAAGDAEVMTLEARLSNHPARQFYAALGFEEVGYRKQYYAPDAAGIREDAVLMTLSMEAPDAT